MKMQKLLFAAALACAVLAGCGNKDETPAGGGSATQPSAGGTTTPPADQVKSVTAAVITKAQDLFDQATKQIADKKMDLADGTITQLESMKKDLPPEWAGKVDQLRQAFTAAKGMGGGAMPKIPGM